jgi:hypothetical protein
MRGLFAAVGIVALLAVADCAGLPVGQAEYSPSFQPGEQGFAAGNMPVLVRGNPFPLAQAEFDHAVAEEMRGWEFGPQLNFTAAADSDAAYRVAMVFNPVSLGGTAQLCNQPLAIRGAPGAAGARVPLAAALCRGAVPLSYVEGSIGTGEGPRSAAFRRGIGQVTQMLFPSRNPQNAPDCTPPC